jgi:hypothetical protein
LDDIQFIAFTNVSFSSHSTSGYTELPYLILFLSANTLTVKFILEPSDKVYERLLVETPNVGIPNDLVLLRPLKAIATASPELAVTLSVRIATYGLGDFK